MGAEQSGELNNNRRGLSLDPITWMFGLDGSGITDFLRPGQEKLATFLHEAGYLSREKLDQLTTDAEEGRGQIK